MRISHLVFVAAAMTAAALSTVPAPALASSDIDLENRRDAARAHAAAIRAAWTAIDGWITRTPRTGDPDQTGVRAPYVWAGPGDLPSHAPSGLWLGEWTDRGLSFRYCDDVLAVFAAHERLAGTDMRTVQTEGGLQWITGGQAWGTPQSGQPTVSIPSCMTLPSGRVALVAASLDPFGWENTHRENDHTDWSLGCPAPGGDPSATAGEVRYRQTVSREMHPWANVRMETLTGGPRWPATCAARVSGTFDWGGRTGVPLPEHGECHPQGDPGTAASRNHLAAAVMNDSCQRPVDIRGTEAPRWHHYDLLCSAASSPATVTGGASSYSTPVSEADGSIFYKDDRSFGSGSDGQGYARTGLPYPTPLTPTAPACATSSYCPSPFTSGGSVGDRTQLRKERWIWKEEKPGWDSAASRPYGWSRSHSRTYTEPGAIAGTGVTGVAKGDSWVQEDFVGCYRSETDSSCASRCSCPDGYTGGVPSGHPEIRWYYHEHDGRSGSNPHIIQVDTCACSACAFVPVNIDLDGDGEPDGADTDGDGSIDAPATEESMDTVDSFGAPEDMGGDPDAGQDGDDSSTEGFG